MTIQAPNRRHGRLRRLGKVSSLITFIVTTTICTLVPFFSASAEEAQRSGQPLTLLSDIQEANAVTGVVTARGNVQIFYPAQNMQATSAQAQYYSREGRIVLTGDVFVLQDGNSLQGERITYLIEEGRFEAMPPDGEQVQSVYLLPDEQAPSTAPVTAPTEDYNPKPEFKEPISP
ncbi:MAG: LptA/OstA family protein [Cyanobacteria bacterium J06627_8]